jgi:hypothetical protein
MHAVRRTHRHQCAILRAVRRGDARRWFGARAHEDPAHFTRSTAAAFARRSFRTFDHVA